MINSAKEFVDLRTSEHPDDYLRAARDSASLEVWLEVTEKYPAMKVWVARNKTVPMQILEQLSEDKDPCVRFEVATKNKIGEDLMLKLARDCDPTVRHRIACNKNASDEVLLLLTRDAETLVAEAACHKLSVRAREAVGSQSELKTSQTIYIELLNEGTSVWRPVQAERLSQGICRILGDIPEGETWAFNPGEKVAIEQRVFSDGKAVSVAIHRVVE
jgi:hypothetical protein